MVLPSHLIRHSYAFPLRLSLPSDEDYKTPFLKRLQRWVKVPKYANFILLFLWRHFQTSFLSGYSDEYLF